MKTYNAALQAQLDAYLSEQSGLPQSKAAAMIGVSPTALSQYRNSKYPGDVEAVESKIEEFLRTRSAAAQAEAEKALAELNAIQEAQRKAALPALELEPYTQEQVDFDTFCRSDFRAVKIKACEPVKKSDKLLKFTLDDGSGTDRTIVSGIRHYYQPEQLIGKTAVAILNLPPRKMMGIPSCGMLISAVHKEKGQEKLHLLLLDDSIPAGAKLC